MKKALILFAVFAICTSGLAWGIMKKAVTLGANSSGANAPTNAPGALILGFGGENIQGFGGENIGGLP